MTADLVIGLLVGAVGAAWVTWWFLARRSAGVAGAGGGAGRAESGRDGGGRLR